MNINVDYTLDLTSLNTDTEVPELFIVTSSEFGEGEILETVPLDLFQAVEDAFEAYLLDDKGSVGSGDAEDLLKIVAYLEEVAEYAREAYANVHFVGPDYLNKQ